MTIAGLQESGLRKVLLCDGGPAGVPEMRRGGRRRGRRGAGGVKTLQSICRLGLRVESPAPKISECLTYCSPVPDPRTMLPPVYALWLYECGATPTTFPGDR